MAEPMRFDLSVIASWIEPGSRVLDLGCGTGELMDHLAHDKQAEATGVEIDEHKVAACIAKGLTVLHGDVFAEIADYPDGRFDYVILSQTLQQVFDPAAIITEMLRVGGRGIVSFPNFSHWKNRLMLFFAGRAPVSKELPYQWHDTPNIRVIPIKDFRRFCREAGFAVLRETAIRSPHHEAAGKVVRVMPNLRATYGIYMLGR